MNSLKVLSLKVTSRNKKLPAERAIKNMNTHKEIYASYGNNIPISEWVIKVYNLNTNRYEEIIAYAENKEKAIDSIKYEIENENLVFVSIELNNILGYFINENDEIETIVTKEYVLNSRSINYEKYINEEEYFAEINS